MSKVPASKIEAVSDTHANTRISGYPGRPAAPAHKGSKYQARLPDMRVAKDPSAKQEVGEREEAYRKCRQIAEQKDILKAFENKLDELGLVGHRCIARLLLLTLYTSHLDTIASAVIKGASGGGKSYLLKTVLKFVCDDRYHHLSGMSPKAIVYTAQDLRHRHLIVEEAAGLNQEEGLPYLRMILSEGKIKHEVAVKAEGGMPGKTEVYEKEGPMGLVMTTTKDGLHPEDETRLLSFTVDDGPEQTRKVLDVMAAEMMGKIAPREVDLSAWLALHKWVCLGPKRVKIPYAGEVSDALKGSTPRAKRDFNQLGALLSASALIHQHHRQVDSDGFVIASPEDYAFISPCFDLVIAGCADSGGDQRFWDIYAAVKLLKEEDPESPVTNKRLSDVLDLEESTTSRMLQECVKRNFLVNRSRTSGKPSDWILGDQEPGQTYQLPKLRRQE